MSILGRLSYLLVGAILMFAVLGPAMNNKLDRVRAASLDGFLESYRMGCVEGMDSMGTEANFSLCTRMARRHQNNIRDIIKYTE